jgi:hypothetical protein
MRGKLLTRLLISFQVAYLVAAAAAGPLEAPMTGNHRDGEARGWQELSFSLNRLPENPKQYSLVISDADERSISGSFSVDQLQILRAIMVEAEKFALTGEAVGTKEPITTRFMDKQEPAFVVDVQKSSNQSLLFLTLKTDIGRATWEAGRTMRGTRREEGLFFDLLSRLESVLPKPAQPGK